MTPNMAAIEEYRRKVCECGKGGVSVCVVNVAPPPWSQSFPFFSFHNFLSFIMYLTFPPFPSSSSSSLPSSFPPLSFPPPLPSLRMKLTKLVYGNWMPSQLRGTQGEESLRISANSGWMSSWLGSASSLTSSRRCTRCVCVCVCVCVCGCVWVGVVCVWVGVHHSDDLVHLKISTSLYPHTPTLSDDHTGRRCRTGAGRQPGPVLRRHCVQRKTTQEELEEHL